MSSDRIETYWLAGEDADFLTRASGSYTFAAYLRYIPVRAQAFEVADVSIRTFKITIR